MALVAALLAYLTASPTVVANGAQPSTITFLSWFTFPGIVNTRLAALQAVTAADVQRVVRRYITGAHKVIIEYRQQPEAAPAAAQPKSPS